MRYKKGFTLVEVIISIAALGIICAVLLRLFVLAGNTSSRTGEMQEAGLCAATAIETLQGADTLSSGLYSLGINCPENTMEGDFDYTLNSCDITISIQKKGEFPGTLCGITVNASIEGDLLASYSTAKYYKEQKND